MQAWVLPRQDGDLSQLSWARWLAEHGVEETIFCYHASPPLWNRVPMGELPSMRAFADSMRAALPEAGRLGIKLWSCGIPECVLKDSEAPRVESRRLFDETLRTDGAPAACSRARRKAKAFPAACRGCRAQALCEGVWKGYLENRGEEEFSAI